jgi:hypothetical protein
MPLGDDPKLCQVLVEVNKLPSPDDDRGRIVQHLHLPQNLWEFLGTRTERKQERIAVHSVDSNEDFSVAADNGNAVVVARLAFDLSWSSVVEHPF